VSASGFVRGRAWRRGLGIGSLILITAAALWTWWAETHPGQERRLRVLVHDRLDQWFPEQMRTDDGWHGLHRRPESVAVPDVGQGPPGRPAVVLVHGLDEPGTIWDDLAPALTRAGFEVWEYRYPNDQGIDRSAQGLAADWHGLSPDRPVVLIGHSMGGLVARDFVSRLRHPVESASQVTGAPVTGLILVGTPNQGSEWARLRVWLELRDQFASAAGRRFSLFSALRDGTGEAKIDLRPGSDFLNTLNARPWPVQVRLRVIEGRLLSLPPDLTAGLAAAAAEVHSEDLARRLDAWWSTLGDDLGDGVVTLDSAQVPGGPAPLVLNASHRGLLLRQLPGAAEPPAIAPILATLEGWLKE
jgi:pimeloyl-ACP methyl ester carboxylesterase